jgi:chromosome segregation protein
MTLKGFKSFANPTTLKLEPGITCVVGPNGSGKSNVVDALSWVMGEQGAKSLRGGKMEDVIFAGTTGKAPLGRAEVSLTIDNSDGALPIDFAEVTISRILFRNGQSEYQINGESARLLDIQELLSDSGIGREMHVIVGQGQLDAILMANPEERRGFIEEAAGVLKHRKRKEKALRKLDSMQANMSRVQDLTAELRRQLRPLGKQAEVAKKASTIQADLRDAKLRILADDIVTLKKALAAEVADETSLRAKRSEVERELERMRSREIELDNQSALESPLLSAAQDTFYRLSGEREKLRATQTLASERAKIFAEDLEEARSAGRDPESLEQEAAALEEDSRNLQGEVEIAKSKLESVSTSVGELDEQFRTEESLISSALRALADAREASAKRVGALSAIESKITAANGEVERLQEGAQGARLRLEEAEREYARIEAEIAGAADVEARLDREYEIKKSKYEQAQLALEKLRSELAEVDRELSAAKSKQEALIAAATHKDGAGALLADPRGIKILGTLASLLQIEAGWESAVATVLGTLANAIVVEDLEGAVGALEYLKSESAGSADLVILNKKEFPELPLPEELIPLVSKVKSELLGSSLQVFFANTVIAETLDEASKIIRQHPDLLAITRDGDFVSSLVARGGGENSLIEIRSLIERGESLVTELNARTDQLKFEISQSENEFRAASSLHDEALALLNDSDAKMGALSEQMAVINQTLKSAREEIDRFEESIQLVKSSIAQFNEELESARNLAGAKFDLREPETGNLEELRRKLSLARDEEVSARLALRTAEERVKALLSKIADLRSAAQSEREGAARQVARREFRSKAAIIAQEIAATAYEALIQIEISISKAASERERLEISRSDREGETLALRAAMRELSAELDLLTSSVHKDEIARAEQRLRIEQIENKVLEEFGLDSETLVNEYGPEVLVPTYIESESGELHPADPIHYKREQQEKRLAAAERSLTLLGKINPLALEEYSALEERLKYLADQLEDLKKSRKDLLDIIKEVDDKVLEIFTSAYHDTAREFESIFSRLFPGGEGRLILTNPDDMLTTGIDVEARPPGKRIKRLSLLSGGERSLTAVALLIAIFKARPSPFYVMDEVEAALDDTNLGRLLGILAELRDNSQLIVITHQKRTMEIADSLYGVTMRGDGVSEVISQRIREVETVN